MLLVFNRLSQVLEIASLVKCGRTYAFKDNSDIDALVDEVAKDWFFDGRMRDIVESDRSAFLPYTADGMTRQLVTCFNTALESYRAQPR
jgi:hypothetical protein